jgi:hypothetical protein
MIFSCLFCLIFFWPTKTNFLVFTFLELTLFLGLFTEEDSYKKKTQVYSAKIELKNGETIDLGQGVYEPKLNQTSAQFERVNHQVIILNRELKCTESMFVKNFWVIFDFWNIESELESKNIDFSRTFTQWAKIGTISQFNPKFLKSRTLKG